MVVIERVETSVEQVSPTRAAMDPKLNMVKDIDEILKPFRQL